MADDTTSAPPAVDKPETRAEAEDKPESSDFWMRELQAAGKRDDPWVKRARKVVSRYRDERKETGSEKRANILWSNTEILKAALFQGLGTPDVRRRYPKRGKDEKNAKQAALVMERAAAYSNDAYDCEAQIEACVEDMVLPGRGVAWVVYDAEFYQNPETGEEELRYQTVKEEHVFWEDYRTSAGREEKDIWWKARRHFYTRDELKGYFPKHGDKIPLNASLSGYYDNKRKDDDTFKRGAVWEIWDKSKKQRIYVAEDYKLILKKEDDPYRLKDFFPAPEPLYGVKTTSDLEPIPEFCLYQDQANELDTIATRLAALVEALKRRGVYDASMEGPDNQLSQLAMAGDNVFVPFKGFASLQEKGGLKNVFQTEDLQPLQVAIQGLTERAVILIQQIYEITGISDIMRGSAEKDQTATEASLKANFGSMRLQKRQKRVQRFQRDILRIKTEIIAEHFGREQLIEMTGIEMPLNAEKQMVAMQLQAIEAQAKMAQQPQAPGVSGSGNTAFGSNALAPPQMMGHNGGPPMQPPSPAMMEELQRVAKAPSWEDISGILRSDERRCYKIDVETDQTSQVDEQKEKEARIEFMSTMQAMMEKSLPVAMQMPQLLPLLREGTMFMVKGFKAGRPLEEAFEDAFANLEKMPAQKPQNPEIMKIEAEQKSRQAELQFKAVSAQQDAQIKQQTAQHEKQMREAELAHQMQLEQFKAYNQADIEQKKLASQQQLQERELAHRQTMAEGEYQQKAREFEQASLLKDREFAQNQAMADRQFERDGQNQDREFQLKAATTQSQHTLDRERFEHERDTKLDETSVKVGDERIKMHEMVQHIGESIAHAQKDMAMVQQETAKVVEALIQGHQELIAARKAPKKIVRDASGRAVGIDDGQGGVRMVERDPRTGRAVGLT